MESEVSAQSGQHDVGCTVTTSITRPCSVIWMCSTRIPSGRESRDVPSIRASLLRENTRLDETISLPANVLLSKRAVSPKSAHEPLLSQLKKGYCIDFFASGSWHRSEFVLYCKHA